MAELPVVSAVRVFMAHAPGLVRYGSKPTRDIARDPSVGTAIAAALRSWEAARDYPPNQVFLGALGPDALHELPRPWFGATRIGQRRGAHGELMPEAEFVALLKICDAADLVSLESGFVAEIRPAIAAHPLMSAPDLARLGACVSDAEIETRLNGALPALPLILAEGRRVGCVLAGHEDDATDGAPTMLEPLPEADAIVSTSFFKNRTLGVPTAPPVARVIGLQTKSVNDERRTNTGTGDRMVPTAGPLPPPWRYDDHYGFGTLSCIE